MRCQVEYTSVLDSNVVCVDCLVWSSNLASFSLAYFWANPLAEEYSLSTRFSIFAVTSDYLVMSWAEKVFLGSVTLMNQCLSISVKQA